MGFLPTAAWYSDSGIFTSSDLVKYLVLNGKQVDILPFLSQYFTEEYFPLCLNAGSPCQVKECSVLISSLAFTGSTDEEGTCNIFSMIFSKHPYCSNSCLVWILGSLPQ